MRIIKTLNNIRNGERKMHKRFQRTVLATKKDFTGSLAKWLVKLSPYNVPDNLEICVRKFGEAIDHAYDFDQNRFGFIDFDLSCNTQELYDILESIPEIMALNERKNGRDGIGVSSVFMEDPDPDDDFIDIMALAQNIIVDFASEADSQQLLDSSYYASERVNVKISEEDELTWGEVQEAIKTRCESSFKNHHFPADWKYEYEDVTYIKVGAHGIDDSEVTTHPDGRVYCNGKSYKNIKEAYVKENEIWGKCVENYI
jgi:hypothetical protein